MALETKIEVRSAKDIVMLIIVFCMFAGVGYVLYSNFFASGTTNGGAALQNFFSPSRQKVVNPNFSTDFLSTDQFSHLQMGPRAQTNFELGREQTFTPF